jgi:hypothetical protein
MLDHEAFSGGTTVSARFRGLSGDAMARSFVYAPNTLWMIRSISLIPMNGRITPPSP